MPLMTKAPLLTLAALPFALMSAFAYAQDAQNANNTQTADTVELDAVHVTAEQQLQQSLGVSRISAEEIEKRPATNDISELVRAMPDVNLTGNTATTGQRGNKRQIDLRGMGPENPLILIDGKPVTSRNAGRLHWQPNANHGLTLNASYSRQGNIYNGDTQNSNAAGTTRQLLAKGVGETARLYRSAFSLTHNGTWDWGTSRSYISYDYTKNSHLPEALYGRQALATYFHNAYRNKIVIGGVLVARSNIGNRLYQWSNTPKATIAGFEGNLVIPLHETLKWSNNFTYMTKSEDYRGKPLSLIPKYTINSPLAWTPNEHWDANLTFTYYGRQKLRLVAVNRIEAGRGSGTSLSDSSTRSAAMAFGG